MSLGNLSNSKTAIPDIDELGNPYPLLYMHL